MLTCVLTFFLIPAPDAGSRGGWMVVDRGSWGDVVVIDAGSGAVVVVDAGSSGGSMVVDGAPGAVWWSSMLAPGVDGSRRGLLG